MGFGPVTVGMSVARGVGWSDTFVQGLGMLMSL